MEITNSAIINNDLKKVEYCIYKFLQFSDASLDIAIMHHNLDMVKSLSRFTKGTELGFDYAAQEGNLEMVEFLYSIDNPHSSDAFDFAARNNKLDMLKFLHSVGISGTNGAIELAASNGHLDVVKYLKSIGYESDTAILLAEDGDHQLVVEFLN